MQNRFYWFCLFPLAAQLLSGCQGQQPIAPDCPMQVPAIKQQLLQRQITDVQAFKTCYFLRDTVFEGDEGAT